MDPRYPPTTTPIPASPPIQPTRRTSWTQHIPFLTSTSGSNLGRVDEMPVTVLGGDEGVSGSTVFGIRDLEVGGIENDEEETDGGWTANGGSVPRPDTPSRSSLLQNTLRNRRSSPPLPIPLSSPTLDSISDGPTIPSPPNHPSTKRNPPSQQKQNLLDDAAKPVLDRCAFCSRPLAVPTADDPEPWIPVRKLKPRLVREIRRLHPTQRSIHPSSRICRDEVRNLLGSRINHLLEEDQTQLSRLLDEAMRNLGQFEQQEPMWQRQFAAGWTFGEKAADIVARFGGSWKFIGCLLGFLGLWMGLNLILSKVGSSPWDEFPFILLNLFLSSVAALQAPVIMMSQNRQAQLDRSVNDYVSRTVLRAEHQVRHVNAKVDHLLSPMATSPRISRNPSRFDTVPPIRATSSITPCHHPRILHSLRQPPFNPLPHPRPLPNPEPHLRASLTLPTALTNPVDTRPWSIEVTPDAHTWVLMRHHLGLADDGGVEDDDIIFAHWHTDGDNYLGLLGNVHWEGMVSLRNDFDLPHMRLLGRILRVEVYMKTEPQLPIATANFHLVTNPPFTSNALTRLPTSGKPLSQSSLSHTLHPLKLAVLILAPNQRMRHIRVDFIPLDDDGVVAPTAHTGHIPTGTATSAASSTVQPIPHLPPHSRASNPISSLDATEFATLYYRPFDPEKVDQNDDDVHPEDSERRHLLLPIARTRTDPRPKPEAPWRTLAAAEWGDEERTPRPVRVWVEVDLVGPASFAFFCDEARVTLFGVLESGGGSGDVEEDIGI
ncbi:hypothetical protein BC829DRAFT_448628 [Chytridium lagenaria]|nr:hypothetical protein BC829DRAFT_448628 [Chytridium lagenaria]